MVKTDLLRRLGFSVNSEDEFVTGTITVAKGDRKVTFNWFGPQSLHGPERGKVTIHKRDSIMSGPTEIEGMQTWFDTLTQKKGFALVADFKTCSVCGRIIKAQYDTCIAHRQEQQSSNPNNDMQNILAGL